MEKYEHISKARLKALTALGVKKFRRREGAFLVEGETLLREAIGAGWRVLEVVADEEWIEKGEMLPALREQDARIYKADSSALRKLSDTFNPQPVISVVLHRETQLSDVPPNARGLAVPVGVQDPGNVGAIIRCADAFGLAAVILTDGCAEWQNPKVLRASMGSCFHVPIISDVSLDALAAWLAERKVATIAAVARGGEDITKFVPPPAWALLLGNEAAGLPEDVANKSQYRVTLLTPGRAESLNVAVSAGVILHILTHAAAG
jgi:TrmH family RNA methyltransferase